MALFTKKENMLKIRKHKDIGSRISSTHKVDRMEVLWISQTGRQTYIADMDSNHINNTIKKIERGEQEDRRHFLAILKDELILRLNVKYGS